MQIVRIDGSNLKQLEGFIENLGSSASTFRYFKNRPASRVLTNLYAVLLLDDNEYAAAYGHLEREENTIWLGIAVLPDFQGRGLAKKVMDALLEEALLLNIEKHHHVFY